MRFAHQRTFPALDLEARSCRQPTAQPLLRMHWPAAPAAATGKALLLLILFYFMLVIIVIATFLSVIYGVVEKKTVGVSKGGLVHIAFRERRARKPLAPSSLVFTDSGWSITGYSTTGSTSESASATRLRTRRRWRMSRIRSRCEGRTSPLRSRMPTTIVLHVKPCRG